METLFIDSTPHTASENHHIRRGTGSMFKIKRLDISFLNSKFYSNDSTSIILRVNNLDDNLIRLREKFNVELDKLKEISNETAIDVFNDSLFYLTKISPEKITIEVTENDSLYFSLMKNDYSIYLEEHLDDGEVNVTLFKNGVKQNSISGNIQSVSQRLHEVTSY